MKKNVEDFGFVPFQYDNGFDSKEEYQTIKKKVKKMIPDVKDVELENNWKVIITKKDGSTEWMMMEHIK